ncbi:helix-turn-helix transcriptional regulator [Algoriphagus chordae]|uniref:Regulatory LuxR family protein n=1 Tax=Algoriphagus chordae TaxID=237019 RepID=A0A2W7QZJ9_9BACT|nr:helix-turn-helix transcriptional regulator [Algoriphagus chordae]PZX49117.1 regulatory LuxR family protein [Algoriphagus chordae]
MEDFSSDSILQMWKKGYSSQLNKYSKFRDAEQFHRIAEMCAPGQSYYYILNFTDISLDFIHPNVEHVIGINPVNVTMATLLKNCLENELKSIHIKEAICTDFITNYLAQEDYLSYKIIYTYKCTGRKGKNQTMLIQSTPLSLTKEGKIEHVFGLHTDISHLGNITTDWISFISLNGKQSYLNIKAEQVSFDPRFANLKKETITTDLTKREKEIVKLMSQGHTAKAISEKLFISFNTTRTHRKNILFKTNCSNTAELMAKCLAEGVI